jgi:hypothetical protein
VREAEGPELWAVFDQLDQYLAKAIAAKTSKLKRNGDWRAPRIGTFADEQQQEEPALSAEEGDGGKEKEGVLVGEEDGSRHEKEEAREKEECGDSDEEHSEAGNEGKRDDVDGAEAGLEAELAENENEEEEEDPVHKEEWRLLLGCLLNKFIPKACKTVLRKRSLSLSLVVLL